MIDPSLDRGQVFGVDARVPALAVAAGLLMLRAPFLVVVAAAAGLDNLTFHEGDACHLEGHADGSFDYEPDLFG